MTATSKKVIVTDRMQRGYVYWRTPGRPEFRARVRAGSDAEGDAPAFFGGKYLTDCRQEFPKSWFVGAKLCRAAGRATEPLRRERVTVARRLGFGGM